MTWRRGDRGDRGGGEMVSVVVTDYGRGRKEERELVQ